MVHTSTADAASAPAGRDERRGRGRAGTRRARWGARLLVVSPAYFLAVVAVNAAGFARTIGTGQFADITRPQMDALGATWVLAGTLFPLAFLLGTTGVLLLTSVLWQSQRGWVIATTIAAALAIAGFVPYAPLRIAAMGFTENRLGDNALYTAWDWAYAPSAALYLTAKTVRNYVSQVVAKMDAADRDDAAARGRRAMEGGPPAPGTGRVLRT